MDDIADSSNVNAATYHQLGMVAQERGQLDDAEDVVPPSPWPSAKELGDRLGMAASYHQLGRVAQDRGSWMTPRTWYRQALAI